MKTETKYFGSLESLRGIAALIVAIFHADWLNPVSSLGIIRNGYLMVDFFFVLSGFVICHTYANRISDGLGFARFVFTRLGRLYPLHIAMLSVWVGIELLKYVAETRYGISASNPAFSRNDLQAFAANVFLANSIGFKEATFNGPSWSIGAEFYTYLAFAAVVFFLGARAMAFFAISAIALALLIFLGETDLTTHANYGLIRCLHGFFLGATGYILFQKRRLERSWMLWAAVAATLLILFLSPTRSPIDFLLPFIFIALILTAASATSEHPVNSFLNTRPLRWLGQVSYSIYMVHAALALFFKQALVHGLRLDLVIVDSVSRANTGWPLGSAALLLYIACVLFISHFTFKWIEHPFREKAKAIANQMRATHAPASL